MAFIIIHKSGERQGVTIIEDWEKLDTLLATNRLRDGDEVYEAKRYGVVRETRSTHLKLETLEALSKGE